jgi:competence protein ComGC
VADTKLLVISLTVLVIIVLLLIMTAAYLTKFIRKQVAAKRGVKEYEKLFGGEIRRITMN